MDGLEAPRSRRLNRSDYMDAALAFVRHPDDLSRAYHEVALHLGHEAAMCLVALSLAQRYEVKHPGDERLARELERFERSVRPGQY